MIPLKDNNPTSRFPVITIVLVSLNVVFFIYMDILGFGDNELVSRLGLIPYNIVTAGQWTASGPLMAGASFLTSQFLHGGFFHLAGNMLFLWIFGDNVEGALGHIKFAIFYIINYT